MRRDDLTAAFRTIPGAPLRGSFFRAIPLEHRTTPLSAIGSIKRGGRYNPANEFEAYYLAESPETTLDELRVVAPNIAPTRMKPIVTFAVDVALQHTVDLTGSKAKTTLHVMESDLLVEWRALVARGDIPTTHEIGIAARRADVEALRVPSARLSGAANLVVLVDRLRLGSSITIEPSTGFESGTQVKIEGRRPNPQARRRSGAI